LGDQRDRRRSRAHLGLGEPAGRAVDPVGRARRRARG
jgi:hypothetical protein